MKLKIRKDNSSNWSFVETYNCNYLYNGERTLKTLFSLGVTDTRFICKPLKMIKGYFKELEFTDGFIDDWVDARKPIYSILGLGMIIEFKAIYGEEGYLPDKSSYKIYSPYFDRASEEYLPAVPVLEDISEDVDKRIRYFMDYLFNSSDLPSKSEILEKRIKIS